MLDWRDWHRAWSMQGAASLCKAALTINPNDVLVQAPLPQLHRKTCGLEDLASRNKTKVFRDQTCAIIKTIINPCICDHMIV